VCLVATVETRRFSDGEINVDIQENVRGGDVFVIQSTSTPGNDHLMELLRDARRLSARRRDHHRGGAVLWLRPPGPEGRAAHADQRQAGRRPDRDRRCLGGSRRHGPARGQIQGFFNIPVDNL
jgi:ribose-phosphate pyrophosphokinase